MTVNPQMRSLAEPQAAAVLSDGLEQVEIQQVMVRSAGGRWQDVTEDQWIAAEEAEPDERTGESQVIFSWREPEEVEEAPAEPASWQIRFRCRMSEAMRNESFLSGDEEVLFAAAELTGKPERRAKRRKFQAPGARYPLRGTLLLRQEKGLIWKAVTARKVRAGTEPECQELIGLWLSIGMRVT